MREVRVYLNTITLARAAADRIVSLAEKATAARGRFIVALSGGSTPRALYELLATEEYQPLIDWGRVHVFWGDERCVPPEHRDSNYHMARTALLDFVPTASIHRIHGEIEPQEAADKYEKGLREFFAGRLPGGALPQFDLVIMGMGKDGHTASLFPGTTALNERERWVVAQHVEAVNAWRVTLTPPIFNAAHHALFLVTGADKADTVQAVLEGEPDPDKLPAQRIQPTSGTLTWLLDQDAASKLKG